MISEASRGLSGLPPGEKLEGKRARYLEICKGNPDALFVLSDASLNRQTQELTLGSYRQPSRKENPLGGSKARCIAAAELASTLHTPRVFTVSRLPGDKQSHAEIMARGLQKYGVSLEKITQLEGSRDTFTEILELVKLAADNPDWVNIAVVTNQYHIARAELMLKLLGEGEITEDTEGKARQADFAAAIKNYQERREQIQITFVPAEKILPLRDPKYQRLVREAMASPAWAATQVNEDKGLSGLREKKYEGLIFKPNDQSKKIIRSTSLPSAQGGRLSLLKRRE